MRAVITQALVAKLKPGDYTVFDKTERGLALRVLASGVKTWRVRLKASDGSWYWWKLGAADALKPEKAREQAHIAKGAAAAREDPREAKHEQAREAQRQMTLSAFIEDKYGPWVRANARRARIR